MLWLLYNFIYHWRCVYVQQRTLISHCRLRSYISTKISSATYPVHAIQNHVARRASVERSHPFEVGLLELVITGENLGTKDNGNFETWTNNRDLSQSSWGTLAKFPRVNTHGVSRSPVAPIGVESWVMRSLQLLKLRGVCSAELWPWHDILGKCSGRREPRTNRLLGKGSVRLMD